MIRLKRLIKAMTKGGSLNLKALFICLVIAFLLWLVQSMGREYTTDIVLPIEYANLPEDKTFSAEPASELQLKVTGFGWDLWAYAVKFNKPSYTINLDKLGNESVISLNGARDLIVESVPGLTNILSVQPEIINLELDEAMRKKVPVVSAINIEPASGYGFSLAYPEPDSVEIFGPTNIISQIDQLYTETKSVANAQDELEVVANLIVPEGVDKTSHKSVTVKALLEPMTEKELEISIKVRGYKGNKKVNIFPRVATLKLQTTLGLFEKVEASDFDVYVDLSNLDTEADDLLPVQVTNNNKLITNYRIHPKYVNYILEE